LPSRQEVEDFASTNSPDFGVILYDTKPKWDEIKEHQWRSGIDFMICVPVDDWNLYRNSWDTKEWKAWTD